MCDGRRNVCGITECASGWTDPVLAASDLAWRCVSATYALHQSFVCLQQKWDAQGQAPVGGRDAVQGAHVVEHLFEVAAVLNGIEFKQRQVRFGCLGSFDTAGEYGLAPDDWGGQDVADDSERYVGG